MHRTAVTSAAVPATKTSVARASSAASIGRSITVIWFRAASRITARRVIPSRNPSGTGVCSAPSMTKKIFAAVVSAIVYEPRRDEQMADRMPSLAVRDALATTTRIWSDIVQDETELGLPQSPQPELGFVWASYRWTKGERLERVLSATAETGAEMSAGDFIRWCKQLLDLLEQVASAPSPAGDRLPVAVAARAAIASIRRGVVVQSMQV